MHFGTHYHGLLAGYAVALATWLVASQFAGNVVWPGPAARVTKRPWMELGWTILAVAVVCGLGVIYSLGVRLPSTGTFGPLLEAVNHAAIFSPIVGVVIWRKHGRAGCWLPEKHVAIRIGVGLLASALAVVAFTSVRKDAHGATVVLPRLIDYRLLPHLVQVSLEDLCIAVLFVRIGALLKRAWILAPIVGLLFAAGHLPSMATNGISIVEVGYLAADFLLGTGVILVLQRSRDIWWFVPVHFAMDMMQFASVSGVAFA